MKNMLKKIIAFTLCILLTFSVIPVSASAIEDDTHEQTVNDVQSVGGEVGSLLGWFLPKVGNCLFSSTLGFGVNRLLNQLFPASSAPNAQLEEINQKLDELSEKLDLISFNQERIYDKLCDLESFMVSDQYNEILNNYSTFLISTDFINGCYTTLNSLSADSSEELAEMQLSLLTDEIGIDDYVNATALIDQKRSEYYGYITTKYYVQVDGANASRDIFGVYRELMRNTYCWENSAQEQINEFNEGVVMNYLFVALMDILSIEARIARIDEHNADPANANNKWNKSFLETLLTRTIPAEAAKVFQMYVDYSVDIPDKYLHFWKGSSDFWFDSTVLSTERATGKALMPTAAFKNGLIPSLAVNSGNNFSLSSGFTNRVFQKEFFRGMCDENKPGNSSLVTTQIINTMLSSCSNVVTLGEILAEAGFNYEGSIDNILLNIDDDMNAAGTQKSTITYAFRSDIDLEYKCDNAFMRCITTDTKECVGNNGAEKCEIYCYIDVSQRDELADRADTVSLYISDANPAITDCDRLFVYDADDIETCAHTVLTETRNSREATCTEEGYTGDTYCLRCGKTVAHGEVIEKCAHNYELSGTDYICSNCGAVKECCSEICGDFTVTYLDDAADFSYSDDVLLINTESPLEIKNTNPEVSTTDIIRIADNTDANITLAGVNIDVSGPDMLSPLLVSYNSGSDVTVTLKAETENFLRAGSMSAAIEKDGTQGSLTIDGSGYLYASGGNNGSAIGSGYELNCANITVKGGVITAEHGNISIGHGKGGASSDIVIYPTASVKAETIGCTPVNADGEQVFLNVKDNPCSQPIFVDGVKFPYANHNGESKVYIYLNGNEHDICFPINGKNETVVDFENGFIYGISPLSKVEDCIRTAETVNYSCDAQQAATGITVSVYDSETDYGVYTFVLFGDVNGDGWYDGQDATIVSCLVNGILSEEQVGEAVYMAADCNHDGVIDSSDVLLLEQAGVLKAQIDQAKSEEELLETSSAYVEYLNLIQQSPETEKTVEDIPTDAKEPVSINWFEMFVSFLKTLLNFVYGLFTL